MIQASGSARKPRLSVVMPTYNGEAYIASAIESILNQTFLDFEFIIVDDGSTDNTLAIINTFSDKRIHLFRLGHRGLGAALAFGVQQSSGELIARMDQDDISLAARFQTQTDYFDENHDIGLVGSSVIFIDKKGCELGVGNAVCDPVHIKARLIARNLFYHPTTMMKKEVLLAAGGYDSKDPLVSDFDLWLRMIHISKLSNIITPLLKYRIYPDSLTHRKQKRILWKGICSRYKCIKKGTYPYMALFHLIIPFITLLLPLRLIWSIRGIEAKVPSMIFSK